MMDIHKKQKGKLKLINSKNITFPFNSIAIVANKNLKLTLDDFKIIKLDLSRICQGNFDIIYNIFPNRSFTKKGILVRMGKGKGKIDTFGTIIRENKVCIILRDKKNNLNSKDTFFLNSFIKKYPFFNIKTN